MQADTVAQPSVRLCIKMEKWCFLKSLTKTKNYNHNLTCKIRYINGEINVDKNILYCYIKQFRIQVLIFHLRESSTGYQKFVYAENSSLCRMPVIIECVAPHLQNISVIPQYCEKQNLHSKVSRTFRQITLLLSFSSNHLQSL